MASAAPSRHVVHKDPLSSRIDKSFFFALVTLGSLVIYLMREYGVAAKLVAITASGLIVLYAFAVVAAKGLRIREDRAADNCYYLGFIYTLVSLMWALQAFQFGGQVTDELIRSFGIALMSTIVGIIARLLLNQLRTDPVEIERETRMELSDTARALRSELQQAVNDVNAYRRGLHQSLEEAMRDVSERANQSITESTERFAALTTDLAERIDTTFADYQANAARLTEASQHTVAALEAIVARLEAIEAPADMITSRFEPAVAAINEAAEAVRKHASTQGREVQRLSRLVETACTAAETLETRLGEAQQRETAARDEHEAMRTLVKELQAAIARLRDGLQTHAAGVAEVERALKANVDSIKAHNAGLEAELTRSRELGTQLHSELAGFAQLITERLGSVPRPPEDPERS